MEAAPGTAARMQAVAEKWLAARRLTDASSTVEKLELAVWVFGQWLGGHHPGITTFADVTRRHCLDRVAHIAEAPAPTAGKLPGVMSRIQRISGMSQFFRDTALWQYDDVPGHTLIGAGDAPKYPQKVLRFIPDQDLDRLMPAIDAIACPFQRAALLVACWSGARRTEIQRLPLDCLDRYPDGTAPLRLSGRKTYKERVVPLREDAAEALQHGRRGGVHASRRTRGGAADLGGDNEPHDTPEQITTSSSAVEPDDHRQC